MLKTISTGAVSNQTSRRAMAGLSAIAMSLLIAGCGAMGMGAGMQPAGRVTLSGASEVPANPSKATGSGTITVAADHSVSGSVTTSGVDGNAAHIHQAAMGANGPVIVPLTKTAEGTWSVPAGARLTDAQYAGYVAGDLYVNVHSATYAGGEIRGQLNAK